MPDFIKNIWILFFAIMLLGIFISMPVEKNTSLNYYKEIEKIKSEPQRRVDATYRYVEAIENGTEDLSMGLNMIPPRKYYIDSEDEEFYQIKYNKLHSPTYKQTHAQAKTTRSPKPRYIRDKNNPKILYPYK